jgi:hypothetical protein
MNAQKAAAAAATVAAAATAIAAAEAALVITWRSFYCIALPNPIALSKPAWITGGGGSLDNGYGLRCEV